MLFCSSNTAQKSKTTHSMFTFNLFWSLPLPVICDTYGEWFFFFLYTHDMLHVCSTCILCVLYNSYNDFCISITVKSKKFNLHLKFVTVKLKQLIDRYRVYSFLFIHFPIKSRSQLSKFLLGIF